MRTGVDLYAEAQDRLIAGAELHASVLTEEPKSRRQPVPSWLCGGRLKGAANGSTWWMLRNHFVNVRWRCFLFSLSRCPVARLATVTGTHRLLQRRGMTASFPNVSALLVRPQPSVLVAVLLTGGLGVDMAAAGISHVLGSYVLGGADPQRRSQQLAPRG